jgi:hypothetical protein
MENLVNSEGKGSPCVTDQQTESESVQWVLMALNGVAMYRFVGGERGNRKWEREKKKRVKLTNKHDIFEIREI